jgi:glycosyltransferase involved in cell wall biosynthesis
VTVRYQPGLRSVAILKEGARRRCEEIRRHAEERTVRIAQVAPPFERVPPARYGGTESVVATLTDELVRRGHDVTLFASGDSCTPARLAATVDQALWRHPDYRDFTAFWAITLGKLAHEAPAFDIIHNHLDFIAFPLVRCLPCPVVSTLHGRLDLPELVPLYAEFDDVPLVSISNAQRRPVARANWVATIYHGIDLEDHTFVPDPGRYLAFLGRISSDKGLDTAIHVARRAGMPLKIAARKPLKITGDANTDADRAYYNVVIKPLLREPGVEFIGEVGGRDKDRFLGEAAALLFPIRWPEPFGLVMIEAMACGTPVLALNEGSVPEVVEHGRTGYVCANEDELVAAVEHIAQLDRRTCRAVAEDRFSAPRMAADYERVYAALVDDGSARLSPPAA